MQETMISNQLKRSKISAQFVEFNRAIQDLITYGDDVQELVLHDFKKDVDEQKLNVLINGRGPTASKQVIMKTIVAMNMLTDGDRLIIQNEFIRRNRSDWWSEYYTRSQYYRRRRSAVNALYAVLF